MTPRLAADPVERFQQTLSHFSNTSPLVSSAELAMVIDQAEAAPKYNGSSVVDAVTSHVAENSAMTVAQAKPMVKSALDAAPANASSEEKAVAVSQAVSGGLDGNLDLTFSDPVMLIPGARAAFAALLGLGAAWFTWLTYRIADKTSPSSAGLICLFIIGLFSLIGLLVLVMGYKNVTIKGSTGAGGSGGGG